MSRVPRDRFLYGRVSKSERRQVLKSQDAVLKSAVARIRKQIRENAAALQKLVARAQGREDGSMLVCPNPECNYVPRDEDEAKAAACPKCGGPLAEARPSAFEADGDADEQRDELADADEESDEDEDEESDEDETEELRARKDDVTGDGDGDDDLSTEERARRGVAETRGRAAKRSLMDVHRDGKAGAPLIDGVRQPAARRRSGHGGRLDAERL